MTSELDLLPQWQAWLPQNQVEIDLSRQICEASFYEFIKEAWSVIEPNPFRDNWHIELLADGLQAVHDGSVLNLLMNIPPGCTKSLETCVFWPAWRWAKDPTLRFIFGSYSHGLSVRDAVRTRNLIDSKWYQDRWGNGTQRVRLRAPESAGLAPDFWVRESECEWVDKFEPSLAAGNIVGIVNWHGLQCQVTKFRDAVILAGDQNQKAYYETTAGGYRLSTTPKGRGTGEHPDCLVFDDPHNVEQSESKAEREEVIRWWDLTVTLRGASKKRSERVGIMQRLNEDDLSGHVLKEKNWVHVCLPMRYEPDRMGELPFRRGTTGEFWRDQRAPGGDCEGVELLWPDVIDEEKVLIFEDKLGEYGTAGQLQQRPSPREGGLFKREWFNGKIIKPHAAPRPGDYESLCRYWDKGGTDDGGDPTAGVLIGRKGGDFFIIDVTTGQWSAGKRDDNIDLIATLDESEYSLKVMTRFEEEPGSGGRQSAEISVSRLQGSRVSTERPVGNKEIRAEPLSIDIERGHVFLIEGAWNRKFIDELCSFPTGSHDDQVDAASGAHRYLAKPRKKLLVAGAGEAATPAGATHGTICTSTGCQRPREPGTEFCCAACRENPNGGASVRHSPHCTQRWNDFYIAQNRK